MEEVKCLLAACEGELSRLNDFITHQRKHPSCYSAEEVAEVERKMNALSAIVEDLKLTAEVNHEV